MPRVNYVEKARASKTERRCHRCGETVQAGDRYRWWKFRTGGRGGRKVFACAKPECQPKPSELTQSPHLSALYAAQEAATDAISSWQPPVVEVGEQGDPDVSELEGILESYAEALNEIGEALTESADNIEGGFGHETYQSEELRERASSYEDAGQTAEQATGDLPTFDPPERDEEDDEEWEDVWAEAVNAWAEEAREHVSNAVYETEAY